MEWLKSKTALLAGGCLALVGLQGYGLMSMRTSMEDRVSSVERELQSMHSQDSAKVTQLATDLDVITKKMGINAQELDDAHTLADQLRKESAQTAQRLRRELAAKADSKSVVQLREEATNKLNETTKQLNEVQQDTSNKITGISGDVQGVRTDLNATRDDLANSKRDLNTLIAHNSTELAELRRKGERDYVEFDIKKSKDFQHIGDVLVQLKNTDVKRQKFDVVINSDDNSILKKDRTANEPVTFLVGRDRVRYEFVVNSVSKDRIRGYISTPKDKLLAAESPASRRLPQ
jgi:chromosome segregation ATPase